MTTIVTPRSAIIDPKTGQLTRDGFLFLESLNRVADDLSVLVIIDSIVNGVHNMAPSSNAVYDADADLQTAIDAINMALGGYVTAVEATATYLQLAGGTLSGPLVLAAATLAGLPSAAAAGVGARATVSDASTTLTLGIGTTITGGGANIVPAFSDGVNWIYG